MKRTYRFVEPEGIITSTTERGEALEVPVVVGILKHPTADQLAALLADPVVVVKYTHEALRKAPWNALRRFPRWWLVQCLPDARLTANRRRALEFLLELRPGPTDR